MRIGNHAITRIFRSFWLGERAVAAVEFAFILPIMLLLYIGCTEAGALIIADRKVQSVAGSVGDLVSRTSTTLSKLQLQDIFYAATSIMVPYSTAGLEQSITAVSVSEKGETSVLWSVKYLTGGEILKNTKHPVGKPFTLPSEMIAISKERSVIVSTASYAYKPLLGLQFTEAFKLNRTNYFVPRFSNVVDINW